ncbi:MAG: CaiB/BaiF CoA-transferase family protein [Conexivisphaerales archaeon]
MQPLKNLTVIDVSRLLPGGFCTMVLADLGASVIKVEQPGLGDYMRLAPPFVDGVSPFHSTVNKNKLSISVDLKTNEGREILIKMVKDSDVFVEAFRPGVMKRLGLDYASLRKHNNKLVYCSLSAFGQNEKLSLMPGHDLNFQAMSGIFSYVKKPTFPTVQLADMVSGLYAAIAILAALNQKPRRSVHLDIPITQCLTSLLILHLGRYFSGSKADFDRLLYGEEPVYRFYMTKDKKFLAVAAIEQKFRKNLLRLLGLEEEEEEENLMVKGKRKIVSSRLAKIFKSKDRNEWMELLAGKETCVAPVLEIGEVLSSGWSDAVFDRKLRVLKTPVKMESSETVELKPAPTLGKDTCAIMKKLGYKAGQIENYRKKGIIQF